MKTKLILLLFIIPATIFSQTWDYPQKPGKDSWKEFKSNQEMVAACQIPENLLSKISTQELTKLCLEYPLLYDIFAFNNINDGFNKLFNDFNGIRELFNREDAVSQLLSEYNFKINQLSYLDSEPLDYKKGIYIISISAIEVILSLCTTKNDIAALDYVETLSKLQLGYEKKMKYFEAFKGLGFRTNFFSRAHVIEKLNLKSLDELPLNNKKTILNSGTLDLQSLEVFNNLTNKLLNDKKK